MFEYTSLVLQLMRNQKLNILCNKFNSVFDACNRAYSCLFILFAKQYIKGNCSIMDMDSLSKKMKADIDQYGVLHYLQPVLKLADGEVVKLLARKTQSSQIELSDNISEQSAQNTSAPKVKRKNKYENKQVRGIKEKASARKPQATAASTLPATC